MPAQPDSLAALRHAVQDFASGAGATDDQCQQVALAVSEALTNVVVHAYVDRDTPATMSLVAHVSDSSLHVVVADEGRGLVPRLDSPGLGLGLPLIARLADRLSLEDANPGLRVRMAFSIG